MEPYSYAKRFDALMSKRFSGIERAREMAALTIPSILPENGFNNTVELPDLYSSIPARGITSLSSRMTSAVYPLNGLPFFQHSLNMEWVPQGADPTETEAALARLDRTLMNKLGETNLRQALFLFFQHLIVLGDAVLHMSDDYEFRVIRCDQYVIRRSPEGLVQEMLIRDFVDPNDDPEYFEGFEGVSGGYKSTYGGMPEGLEPVYTCVKRSGDGWEIKREVRGIVKDEGVYDATPYFPVSWNRLVGEDYGRSLIEENIGDIRSLESLSRAMVQGASANSEFRMALDPSAYASVGDMQETENGDWIVARPGEIHSVQVANQVQLQTTNAAREILSRDLSRTFLMSSGSLPTGERVTATQIREIAQELDQSLGGVFSGSARDIQRPIVHRLMVLMVRDGKVDPSILEMVGQENILQLEVKTGLAALNREVENTMLSQWAQMIGSTPAAETVNWSNWATRFTQSLGLETKGIIKTQEEIQAEQQAMAQQQLAMEAGSAGIQAIAKEPPPNE